MQSLIMDSKVCLHSNRIYMDELLKKENIDLSTFVETFGSYNVAKINAYNFLFDETFLNIKHSETVNEMIKSKYKFDNYYTNNIVNQAKGVIESQKELIHTYEQQVKEEIKSIKTKIKSTKKLITQFKTNQQQLIKYNHLLKINKSVKKWKFKNYPLAHHGLTTSETIDKSKMRFFTYYDESVDFYTYSCFINQELKKLKAKLGRLNFAKHRREEKLKSIAIPKRVCFGSRKLFQSKDIKDISYVDWKKELYEHKYSKMLFSGRSDSHYGNYSVKYENQTLTIDLLQSYQLNSKQKNISKSMRKQVVIPNVSFKYGQKQIEDYLKKQYEITTDMSLSKKDRKYLPIAYQIELHTDERNHKYLIVCIILSLPKKTHVNYDTSTGVVSIDLNVDHIALTDIDQCGNLVYQKILHYNVYHKNKGSILHEVSKVTEEVIQYCKKVKKCLVMEKLDLVRKKQQLKYQNKKSNFLISGFVYSKLYDYLNSKAYRNDIYIYRINPAYTSQIGKLKYMRLFGLSIHICAAYVIGRRGMGFKESIPKYLRPLLTEKERNKHQWSQYATLTKKLKTLKKHDFYKNLQEIDQLIVS